MKAFKIKDQNQFMNRLLKSDLFDRFLIAEAQVRGAAEYHVDGHINQAFFEEDEAAALTEGGAEYLPFSYVRAACYGLIRGRHAPLYMKFVFLLSPESAAKTIASADTGFSPEDVGGIFINLTFRDGSMVLTTGVSYRAFTPDHSLDSAWDSMVARFLDKRGIAYDLSC